ncbi:MAG: NAD(P)/FAD-dependent oxidoreductase [Synechococcales cyanobacterium RU_4_20]|nr:NAD(P)/FAD-dependent oxidoreductase [Synechococcales cyanobacterium RU_4_20]NJR68240.1 NAD(P)/FAD-dependent oxidoreductase [Synechococcales cyanobacterium CRU_2_2]
MPQADQVQSAHHVVIVGGGFAGLYAAKSLGHPSVKVTVVDKRNFHLFQPLLYQVATGSVSPADISSPLRGILGRNSNTKVLLDEVLDLDPDSKNIILKGGVLSYDSLIMATGVSHHYFGNDQWQDIAPGLKTIEDALEMRRRIFSAFEAAEGERDPEQRKALLTFVVVGGGPTGVELAGAIAELANQTLKGDFRNIDTTEAEVILIEGLDRVLPPFAPELSSDAQDALARLGVRIRTGAMVTRIDPESVTIRCGDETEVIPSHTTLWAAGVKASRLGAVLAERTGAELDRSGRVIVQSDLSLPGHSDIFVVGDLAHFAHQGERPLPGVAPVAMQAGDYVAKLILKRLQGRTSEPFKYVDRGSMAVIGQNEAVVDLGFMKFSGPFAWFLWVFAHIYYLIEFDNKLVVMTQWAWNYFTRNRGARLITGLEAVRRTDGAVPQASAKV